MAAKRATTPAALAAISSPAASCKENNSHSASGLERSGAAVYFGPGRRLPCRDVKEINRRKNFKKVVKSLKV